MQEQVIEFYPFWARTEDEMNQLKEIAEWECYIIEYPMEHCHGDEIQQTYLYEYLNY